jgi:hypothetical protein
MFSNSAEREGPVCMRHRIIPANPASGKEGQVMNPTAYDALFALGLLLVAILGITLFLRYKRSNTERRMMSMLQRAGLDPGIALEGDTKAIVDAVRRRCSMCQAEDICERWLAGEVEGDNEFCPNAEIFEALARETERTA